MKTIILFFFIIGQARANFSDFFASSPQALGSAGQFSLRGDHPGNNYYAPALLAFTQKTHLSLGANYVITNFDPIKNVITRNSINSDITSSEDPSGNIDTDYDSSFMASFHATLPILKKDWAKIGFSVLTPVSKILESNTGSTYLTEYVMYRARYKRSMMRLNWAHPIGQNFAMSLGFYYSFQTSNRTETRQALTDSDNGATGSMKNDVTPALAAIASMAYKEKQTTFFFTLQQKLETRLLADIVGDTVQPSFKYNNTIESLLFYDPMVFRFGLGKSWEHFDLTSTLEYQLWDDYQTPVIRIKQNGGALRPSDDFERTQVENIVIPRLALTYHLNEKTGLTLGGFYRPSPLQGKFSGPGNSVDTDVTALSLGYSRTFTFMDKYCQLSLGLQYHRLKDIRVSKSDDKEDGTAGDKIGSPGYTIGGEVYASGIGLKMAL